MAFPITVDQIASVTGGELYNCSNVQQVTGLERDSRSCKQGDLFIATVGNAVDSHNFIDAAFSAGAVAALVSDSKFLGGRPSILVPDTRRAVSALAAYLHKNPSKEMKIFGVTGTNGKTTVQWMLTHALLADSKLVVRIGTLGCYMEGVLNCETLTNPDAMDLHKYLSTALDADAKFATLEVSSHGLSQYRVADVSFDIGIFTNLTQDHGDYHDTEESYYQAKKSLFELVGSTAIVCIDCDYGKRLYQELSESSLSVLTYGFSQRADFSINEFAQSLEGSEIGFSHQDRTYHLSTKFIGRYNAQNIVATIAALHCSGLSIEHCISLMSQVPAVPGRLESIGHAGCGIYVDYAHTPDSLENALLAARDLKPKNLWVLFGCGGDRDTSKRPEMGRIADRLADKVVVTSDNPRTEDPDQIISDILKAGFNPELVEVDRKQAITQTVGLLEDGDILLIAGKGHEDYQIIGKQKFHFSDQEVARQALSSLS